MSFFNQFPTINYDINKNKTTHEATKILNRVKLRGDISKHIPIYYKTSLVTSERPDILAYLEYSDSYLHWVLMIMNSVIDPYYDWVIDENVLESIIDLKYPNSTIILKTDHFDDDNGYNTEGSTQFFIPNDVISSGSKTGTVVEFNSTLKQLTYVTGDGTFVNNDVITGSLSGAIGKLKVSGCNVLEKYAPHHYENSAGVEVHRDYSRGGVADSTAVSNYTYEQLENEKKRNVSVLNSSYLDEFKNNFSELIRARK